MQWQKRLGVFAWLLVSAVANQIQAATIDIAVSSNRYTPNDVTIQVGDTVRWTNQGGFHNVAADDGSFSNEPSSNAWTFSRTFNTPGTVLYHCQVHSGAGQNINAFMNGRIVVAGAPPPPPKININQGLSGAWFNPATGGQGFLIDIAPSINFMFVAWFTYEVAPPSSNPKVGATEHRWLTGQGNYAGTLANLGLFRTAGGAFNNSKPTTTTSVGSMQLEFSDCNNGTVTFDSTADNLRGTIPITRALPNDALCRSLLPPPESKPEQP